ncbi:hypothetical protein AAB81_003331 [Salmonella enterica subsp. enterica]|nr:hypothetical protein [Salmonella enterica subsp. enterica]EDQ8561298.1 hypothetical protein [Salmonella enterica subsp. enterica serovar Amager]EDR0732451.1 hypothetical protein [Salmonella enterica subsp. enterica serovar Hull]EDT4551658.1 hypothetical protein [Salmonella enterica subsp. enterica serovar Stanleyville]EDX8879579.1 hypothetical protein [Salmonella enterica subsp. enterica serovar Elisabethville]EDZ4710429.1 hypothetical protein [Salmonella enterica]
MKSCRRPALPTTGGRRQCSAVTPTFLHNMLISKFDGESVETFIGNFKA